MKSGKIRRWLLLLIIAGVASGIVWRIRQPVTAAVIKPQRKEVVELVIASGRLRAVRQAEVGPEVSGLVEEVLVWEGDHVTNGQPLVTLRVADLLQQIKQVRSAMEATHEELGRAQVSFRDAETNYTRAQTLFDQKISSTAELDAARTARDTARAIELGAAAHQRESEALMRVTEEQLAKRRIAAPFAGVILKRQVEPGASVTAGEAMLTLAEMSQTEIYVETDENNLGKLRVGQPAQIIAPAFLERPFPAILTQIGPNVDAERGVVGLRLKPGPLPEYVLPNMTVDVNIEVARFTNALAIPTSCVIEQDGRFAVMTIREGRVAKQSVNLLGKNTHWAAVAGLPEQMEVLVQATRLPEGRRVKPRLLPADQLP